MLRLTREQVREIDRRAIEDYHIPGIVLMENAARAVVDVAMEMLPTKGRVLILCGHGNNGGDGFAVARHLHNRGYDLMVQLVGNALHERKGDAAINFLILEKMGIQLDAADPEAIASGQAELVIDGIFGTGLSTPPKPRRAKEIEGFNHYANSYRVPVLAIDLPSGLDCNTGDPLGPCIHATRTVTFVAEKAGFANPASKQFIGEITVGCIGCPRELIEEVAKMTPT